MTNKDYELIAKTIRTAPSLGALARMLALAFRVNPKFDTVKFLEACGVWHE